MVCRRNDATIREQAGDKGIKRMTGKDAPAVAEYLIDEQGQVRALMTAKEGASMAQDSGDRIAHDFWSDVKLILQEFQRSS